MTSKKRGVRPYYVAIENLIQEPSIRETLVERDRALAFEAVLAHAAETGIDKALEKFGKSLLPTEHKLLSTLTNDEFKALKSIRAKIGSMIGCKGIAINIYDK